MASDALQQIQLECEVPPDMTTESYLRQVIAQRNALRTQNGQLWKIIEKQRLIIHQLKAISTKNNELLKTQLSERWNSQDSVDETLFQTDTTITTLKKEYDIHASQPSSIPVESFAASESRVQNENALNLSIFPVDDLNGEPHLSSQVNDCSPEDTETLINPDTPAHILGEIPPSERKSSVDPSTGLLLNTNSTTVEHGAEPITTIAQNTEVQIAYDKHPSVDASGENEKAPVEANALKTETLVEPSNTTESQALSEQKSYEQIDLSQMNELNISESSISSTSDQGLSGAESESLDMGQDFDKDGEYKAHDGSNFMKVEQQGEDLSSTTTAQTEPISKMGDDSSQNLGLSNTGKSSEPLVDLTGLRSLSGVDVKVNGSTVKVNSKGKEVLVFLIALLKKEASGEVELWTIEKLYSDFLALDAKLKVTQPRDIVNQIGKLPDKNLFATHAPSKVDQRKLALQQYLQHLIVLNMVDTRDVCEFFSTNLTQRPRRQEKINGIKEGYLTKKGKNFGGWKRRYFSLKSPILNYFESKDGYNLGSIKLSNCQISKQSANMDLGDDSYRHAFMIVEPKKNGIGVHRHIFCADSDAERDEWVTSLLVYTSPGKTPSVTPSPTLPTVSPQDLNAENGNKTKDKLKKFIRVDSTKQSQASAPANPIAQASSQPTSTSVQKGLPNIDTNPSAIIRDAPDTLKTHRKSTSLKDPPTNPSGLSIASSSTAPKDSSVLDQQPVSPTSRTSGLPQPNFLKKPFAGNLISNAQAKLNKDKEPKKGGRMTFHWGKKIFSSSSGDSKSKVHSAPVFGVPLERAVEISRVKDGYELPAVVYRCIEYLDAKLAHKEEGIYRLSGSSAAIKILREKFDHEVDINLLGSGVYYDVHAIAGLLKLYLRELPTSVLTHELHQDFLHVIDLLNRKERVNELGRLVSTLPLANYSLLRCLIAHLIRIVQHSDINKMTVRNVGIVFSPTLGIPAGVFNLLMTEFEYIFSVNDQGFAAPRTIDDSDQEDDLEEPPVAPQESNPQTKALVDETGIAEPSSISDIFTKPDSQEEAQSFDELQFAASISKFKNPQFRSILRDRAGRNNRNSIIYAGAAPENMVKMEIGLQVRPTSGEYEEDVYDLVHPSGGSSGDNEMEPSLNSLEDESEETPNEMEPHEEYEHEDSIQIPERVEVDQQTTHLPDPIVDGDTVLSVSKDANESPNSPTT
ncbi:Rho GTPase activating protein [Basidiobolus ranarum]|uniref:Rho GTPase activating protein n=1 Tax=Basidiobolus ranarum TaxID=34480 RepID=A0ABR2WMI9_9FUNG